jgi:hypothetical protein
MNAEANEARETLGAGRSRAFDPVPDLGWLWIDHRHHHHALTLGHVAPGDVVG